MQEKHAHLFLCRKTFKKQDISKIMSETEISTLGEFGLIDHLTRDFTPSQPSTVVGVGDDCAVLRHNDMETLVTTDLLLEGIHFDLTYTPLRHLGYKAIVAVGDLGHRGEGRGVLVVERVFRLEGQADAVDRAGFLAEKAGE
ncbi:MAG: hypothetical protein IIZ89_00575, partial [Muribaculaceae bacterium]|nr:hypothetical protein [Muribaculaceae bacterium]